MTQPISADNAFDFIISDGNSPEINQLLAGATLPSYAISDCAQPLELITTLLTESKVNTLHIVAHGNAGGFSIGGQWIDLKAMQDAAALLQYWQVNQIALWSCELGQDQDLIQTLERLTGAQVFATVEKLGWNSELQTRTWDLHSSTTEDQSFIDSLPFAPEVLATWNYQLVSLKVQGIYTATVSGAPDGFFDIETSSITINTTALSATNVAFSQAGTQFSGNNVLGTITYGVAGSTTTISNGLASRPIKVGGVVKGFYVWVDRGTIGTSDASDIAYVLSLDNTYFNATSNISSSSDRVDTALNSVLPVNSAPTGVNDSASFLEDSVAQTGNVLSNDTDSNGDALSVTGFSINGVDGTLGTAFSISGVGSFTLQSTGAYSFTPVANFAGAVPVIAYTLSDGQATSSAKLTISLTPINDAPSSSNKSITTTENTIYTFSSADFSFSDTSDSPPNSLAAVRITSLPSAGELRYNGTAVTLTNGYFEVLSANLSKLTYFVATSNSATSTSFNFKVRDSGGTANVGVDLAVSSNAITLNITGVNNPPVATADTATAVEIGGSVSSPTSGTNPIGSVLTNDTDSDGNTLTVSSVINAAATSTASTPAAGSTSVTNPSSASGVYGTLKIGANGSYIYEIDNANTSVQALKTSSNTLTELFTYTTSDGNGGTSSSTLNVTIQGANDAPVGVNDSNVAKEHLSGAYDPGFNAAGNVLTNDTDVDLGDTRTVTIGSSNASVTATGASPLASSTTIILGSTPSLSLQDDYVFYRSAGTLYPVNNSSSTQVRVTSNSGTSVVLNSVIATSIPAGAVIEFYQQSNANTLHASGSYSSSTNVTSSTTVTTSSESSPIAVGMVVTGTDVPSGTTVSAVSGHTVTLSTAVALSSVALTFSSASANISSGSSVTLKGSYGSLLLQSDGIFSYTPDTDIASLAAGQTATDSFTYTLRDSAGLTSTAQLSITVQGSGNTDPKANADSVIAVETGAAAGSSPSGNVLTGTGTSGAVADTTPSGTLTVTSAKKVADSTGTSVGSNTAITGVYGTLTISSNGDYTYTNFDSNATVNALRTSSNKLTDSFAYTVSNGTQTSSTTITVTINGSNDAPAGSADSTTAKEAGGTANGTPGANSSGNVLTNDSDVDAGDSISVLMAGTNAANTSVTAGTTSANGLTITGSYGVLKLGADGSYTFTVAQGNASVQALLPSSSPLTDTFNYQLADDSGATSTTTLTVNVYGANDAPVNTVPGTSPTVAESGTVNITGVSVDDVDSPSITTKLTVLNGKVHIATLNGATISAGSDNSSTLTLSGSPTQVAAALGTLSYTGDTYFSGTDTLTILSTDSDGLADTSTLDIGVTADNRALTVSGVGVNEASPYVFFTVGGTSGQKVKLDAAGVSVGASASIGIDFLSNIEYYSGTAWTAYTGAAVAMPGATMLVRMPVLQDNLYEGIESLQLTATNTYGTSVTSTSTIRDDGAGAIYLASNTSGTANSSGDAGYPSVLDDDRTLAVNNIIVNEASSHAVFKVDGTAGQVITLALVSGSAAYQTDYATGGITLQYWDASLSTPAWANYSSSVTIPAGGVLFVRTTIFNDNGFEGAENFGLKAVNGSGIAYTGTATIIDDGSGLKYSGELSGGAAITTNLGLDNDLSVAVVAHGPVNEASAYAMFTVTATNGAALTLNVAGSGTTQATTSGFSIQYSTDGSTWTTYSSSRTPVVDGILGSGTSPVYVRVSISSEADSVYEGPETFSLIASIGADGPAPLSASAENTIIDNGTGSRFDGTISGTSPVSVTTSLDSDVPAVTVSSVTVSEASPFAVVRVSLSNASTSNISFTPSLSSGTATIGTDTGNTPSSVAVEYLNGGTWVLAATGVTIAPGATSVLLRTAITNDTTLETSEDFSFVTNAITGVVTNSGASVSGVVTIKDDGSTGSVFLIGNNSNTPTSGTADNDSAAAALTLSVSSLTTTEAGQNGSFTVVLTRLPTADVVVTLSSADTTEGTVSPSTLTFTTANWSTPQTVTVTGVDDTLDDGDITYAVNVSAASSDSGYQGKTGSVSVTHVDNDAPPSISINNVTVSEAVGTATLTVTRSGATGGTTTVDYATVNGTAVANADFSSTSGTLTFGPGETSKSISITINDDSAVEGTEVFTVQLSNVADATSPAETISTFSSQITISDNDTAPPPPPPAEPDPEPTPPVVTPPVVTPPTPEPPPFTANLDPKTDTGALDNVTKDVAPEFTLNGGTYLQPGRTAQLLDPNGQVIGAAPVSVDDVKNGKINVPTPLLDDGTYTYIAQVLDETGKVVASAPVTVTVVTDLDGVMPSVELAANGGDSNRDGLPDWQQNNVAQLPMLSVADYQKGKLAPANSFGAVIAGSPDPSAPSGVRLQESAQLENISVLPLPAKALPNNAVAQTPLFDFTVTSQIGSNLADLDTTRPGLQLQTVILLPANVTANAYMKYDRTSGQWTNLTNPASINGSQDGAALIDSDGDGRVDRIVITITDGGPGDEDGIANGRVVDPGALALVPPLITGPSGPEGSAISEKSIPENTLPVASFKASEPVTWSISGGNDRQLFAINAAGQLVFNNAPDYEAPVDSNHDNAYLIQIKATNLQGNSNVQDVTIKVTDVLDERVPIFAASIPGSDRWLSLSQSQADVFAAKTGTKAQIDFYGTKRLDADTLHLSAWQNVLTGDYFYAPDGVAPPYACYVKLNDVELGRVLKPGKGAFDVHLYLNADGLTQLVGTAQATQMGLMSHGYSDLGALFASAPGPDASVGLVGVMPIA